MPGRQTDVDVLVIGAGPSGLTTAVALARAGVRVLVVERHPGTSIFPKATGVRPRTMEILRSWGLEERVRQGALPVRVAMAKSLTLADADQEEISLGAPSPEAVRRVSPARFTICPQDHVESVLLEHLLAQGGQVRFGTELADFTMDDGGVTARLRARPGGAEHEVRGRYLVGADGANSTVRDRLGIGVEHLGSQAERLTVLFRADLDSLITGGRYALHWVTAPGADGVFTPSGIDGRWAYSVDWDPRRESVADWTPQRWTERLRAATGAPGLQPEIIAVFPWNFAAAVAAAHRAGNAFLVGDAAHRTTPRGATGMNTGIADAHNLGWKLAWVVRGWAGPALLDSYEAERRPVGVHNAAVSLVVRELTDDEGLASDLAVPYRSEVIVPDGARLPAGEELVIDAAPGLRAPHAWVDVDGRRLSTLDLFDGRLTVLSGPRGSAWRRAVAGLARSGLPIEAMSFGQELPDPGGSLARLYGVGESGAVLVRPDGYVAWRARAANADAEVALQHAVALALGRSPATSAPDGAIGLTG